MIDSKIKEFRINNKLSKSEFANAIGVSENMVSNCENGRTKPKVKQLIKIAIIFKVKVDFLLGLKD